MKQFLKEPLKNDWDSFEEFHAVRVIGNDQLERSRDSFYFPRIGNFE